MTNEEATEILRAAADRRLCVHVNGTAHEMEPDEIDEALRLAIDALERDRWISVEERLPEEEESVFVVRKFMGVKGQVPPSVYTEVAYRIGDRWVADSDEYKIARHRHTDPLFWRPLPEPPKEDKQE